MIAQRLLILSMGLLSIATVAFSPAQAQVSSAVVVANCGTPPAAYPAGSNRQVTQNTSGQLCGASSTTPTGTQNGNLAQVNGATVNVGTGAAGTGTQRVTTSTDSTAQVTGIVPAGTAVASQGNPIMLGCAAKNTFQVAATTDTSARVWCSLYGKIGVTYGDGSTRATLAGTTTFAAMETSSGTLSSVAGTPFLWDDSGIQAAFTCSNTASVSVTAGSTTEIVALTASQQVRVCSMVISMSLAGTAQFLYGTGSNCAGTPVNLSGAISLATAAPLAISAPSGGSLMRSAAGNALCITAATGDVTGFITYAKF